jgi:hypothetical protein
LPRSCCTHSRRCRSPRCVVLFDGVAERSRVLAHPRISRDDSDQRRRLAELFCRGKMDRVERTNGLDREWTGDAHEYGLGDRHQITAPSEELERANGGAFLIRGDAPGGPRSNDGACGFSKRE